MKEWCIEHPYLTFFVVISMLSTLNSIANKIVGLFVKPTPTTVNMNIDPTKLPGYSASEQNDDVIH